MLIFNESFTVKQVSKNEFQFVHAETNALVYVCDNPIMCRQVGLSILKKRGRKNTINAVRTVKARMSYNRFFNNIKIQRLFFNIFGKHLSCFIDSFILHYFKIYTLDPRLLDDFLKPKANQNLLKCIEKNYGKKALKLINKLKRF